MNHSLINNQRLTILPTNYLSFFMISARMLISSSLESIVFLNRLQVWGFGSWFYSIVELWNRWP